MNDTIIFDVRENTYWDIGIFTLLIGTGLDLRFNEKFTISAGMGLRGTYKIDYSGLGNLFIPVNDFNFGIKYLY